MNRFKGGADIENLYKNCILMDSKRIAFNTAMIQDIGYIESI
jgi:hypothetical protein